MIDLGNVLGVARAEARVTRRLVRYWVFVVLSVLIAAVAYVQLYLIHRFASPFSASAAAVNPRYFIAQFGSQYLLVFLIGLVFLAFEVRARDKRERMSEVIDALPTSNLEMLAGRMLGLLVAAWVPVVITAGLLALLGQLLGAPLEPKSLISFVFLMAPPAFVFTIGLVFCLTLLVRNRLVAGLAGAAVIAVAFLGSLWFVPLYAIPVIDVTGGYGLPWPSDIIGKVIDGRGLIQRAGYLVAGLGLLGLASAIYPRGDAGSRAVRAGAGAAGLVVGLGLCVMLLVEGLGWVKQRQSWREVHAARAGEPAPDLRSITGEVGVDPGDELTLKLEIAFRAPAGAALETATFSFNPGMEVESVAIEGAAADWTHAEGLLDVELSRTVAPGEQARMTLVARGVPDGLFAYFDAAIEPLKLKAQEAQVFLLGYEPVVFEPGYVALLPGSHWLPAPGAQARRGEVQDRPRDFFTIDLNVDLPADWRVAGPGRAAPAGEGRVRFAPGAPLPAVALLASTFESRSTEIDGVRLELLVHPSHMANVELFDQAGGEVREWLAERMTEASNRGLGYPYDALTLVEVPNVLRGFGGGWRMGTTFGQPGVVMMRETSFPTARFDLRFSDPERFKDREGGMAQAMREQVETFFEADLNGGNPFVAAARSFFGFQTVGEGPEGMPLDYVWEKLSTKLLTDKTSYFSIHLFDPQVGQTFGEASMAMASEERVSGNFANVMIHMLTSTPEVWNTILHTSLYQLDPWENPERAINALSLKGGAMADSLLDHLGPTRTAALLSSLREGAWGEAFDREDVLAAGRAVDEDLGQWIDLWIHETELPGFRLGPVRYERIADREDGTPRYQLVATVVNGEPPPGMVKLEYARAQGGNRLSWEATEPVRVDGLTAVEIGVVGSEPLSSARVAPYLSLNRESFSVALPPLDEERVAGNAEAFNGARTVEWSPTEDASIVVDDLDEGFGVVDPPASGLFGGGGNEDDVIDQGLPIGSLWQPRPRWERAAASYAWGRYRHTMAVVKSGKGEGRASFVAELPRGGAWELEYHLPKPSGTRKRLQPSGTWQVEIVDRAGDRQGAGLDAEAADAGWNPLGRFQLPQGEVRVEVSDETTGRFVLADAVRWTPVASSEVAQEAGR